MWTLALILHILHFSYQQLITNYDLTPFKSLNTFTPRHKFMDGGFHATVIGFTIIVLYFRNTNLTGISVIGLGLLVLNELLTWKKYIFSARKRKPIEHFEQFSNKKIYLFPYTDLSPKPKPAVCILHISTFLCFLCTIWLWVNH